MSRRLVLLVLAVIVSSMAMIEVRHRSRLLYADLQTLHAERDQLNVEWGRLLLEEGAWSQHRRIEMTARTQLGMQLPSAEDIVVVQPASEGKP